MKKLYLTLIFATILTLNIFSPSFTDKYYVKSTDIIDHYSYISKIKDSSLFSNDPHASFLLNDYIYSKFFLYAVSILSISPFVFYNLIIPLICILIATYSFFKIGKFHFGSNGGIFVGVIGSILFWINDFSTQSVPHSISLALTYLFMYFFVTNKVLGLKIILLLISALYPPVLAILFPFYLIKEYSAQHSKSNSKVKLKHNSKIKLSHNYIHNSTNKFLLNIISVIILCSIIVLTNFNLNLDRIHNNDAKNMMEFSENGILPTFFEKPTHGIFSNHDLIGTGLKLFYNGNFSIKDSPYVLLLMLFLLFFFRIKKLEFLPLWGITLYIISYLFIFDLLSYSPSRYFHFSVIPYITLCTVLGFYSILNNFKLNMNIISKTVIASIIFIIIFLPILKPTQSVCPYKDLYTELNSFPKDTVVAGILFPNYLNCIPLHSKKSIISSEAITRSLSFIKTDIRNINNEIIDAYYSENSSEIFSICQKYNITHFVISKKSFTPKTYDQIDEYDTHEPYYSLIQSRAIQSTIKNNSYFKTFFDNENHSPILDNDLIIVECNNK